MRPRVGVIRLQQAFNLLPLLLRIHARRLTALLCEDLDERLTIRRLEIPDAVEQQQESLVLEASDYVAQRIAYRFGVDRTVVVQDVLSLPLDDVLLEERPQVIGSVTTVKAPQQEDSRE